ncbi:MAG: hypothetical protein Q7T86_16310 [Hyphomicrobiaceae bacterium]|nr:hypothetical protein [Hyphomicrobiaceae bacterium]
MSKRRQGSANESLAEALSRVMVSRAESEHHDNYDWATQEGRGDRMPRFLERAIQDVPHASRAVRNASSTRRYQGASRPFARATFLMSLVAVGTGVGISIASPATVAPFLQGAERWIQTATLNLTFTSNANAATPRLAFGEALRNYSEQASAQAARANIVVSNLAPGTTLSAGAQVSDTAWSLPQSELDNLVITFPTGAPTAAMRATVEIPGNSAASSGKFSVELRQAGEVDASAQPAVEGEPEATAEVAPEAPAATAATEAVKEHAVERAPERKATVKARSEDQPKTMKRKPRPSAAVAPKQPSQTVAQVRVTEKPSGAIAAAKALVASANNNDNGASPSASPFLGLFPSLSSSSSTNAVTMFSLGGPTVE